MLRGGVSAASAGFSVFSGSGEDAMFEEGDSVMVKPGIVDPDFGTEIGGWRGTGESGGAIIGLGGTD